MERGAREGMAKNFQLLKRVLGDFVPVSEAAGGTAAQPLAAVVAAAPAVAASQGTGRLMEELVGRDVCAALRPWAAWLHARVATSPAAAGVLSEQVLLTTLACLCALLALHVLVDALVFVQHAAARPDNTIALLLHYACKVCDPGAAHTPPHVPGPAAPLQLRCRARRLLTCRTRWLSWSLAARACTSYVAPPTTWRPCCQRLQPPRCHQRPACRRAHQRATQPRARRLRLMRGCGTRAGPRRSRRPRRKCVQMRRRCCCLSQPAPQRASSAAPPYWHMSLAPGAWWSSCLRTSGCR